MSQAATDLLERALAILDRDGWCRGNYVKDNGNKCIIGALGAAVCYKNSTIAVQRVIGGWLVGDYVGEAAARLAAQVEVPQEYRGLTNPTGRLVAWNDAHDRTYEDVVLAFKKAIEED